MCSRAVQRNAGRDVRGRRAVCAVPGRATRFSAAGVRSEIWFENRTNPYTLSVYLSIVHLTFNLECISAWNLANIRV